MKPCLQFTSLKQYNIILFSTLEENQEPPTLPHHTFPPFPPCHLTTLLPCYLTTIPPLRPCHHFTSLIHLSHLSSSLLSYLFQLPTFPTTNRSRQNNNVLPLGRQDKHVRLIVMQLLIKLASEMLPLRSGI